MENIFEKFRTRGSISSPGQPSDNRKGVSGSVNSAEYPGTVLAESEASVDGKDGAKSPGNYLSEDDEKPSKMDFTIPKLKRKESALLTVGDAHEVKKEILPAILKSFQFSSSHDRYTFNKFQIIHNAERTNSYLEKRKEMKRAGYTEREIADTYAFLLIEDEHEMLRICREGVKRGNMAISCLGEPSMGVQLCRHADVLRPVPFPTHYSGQFLVFKIMKGRVKSVMENHSKHQLEPTPNYDCHIAKSSILEVPGSSAHSSFESQQFYLYEYGDLSVEDRPRHVCPLAVVDFSYTYRGEASHNRLPESPILSPKLAPSPLRLTPPTPREKVDEEFVIWSGNIDVKGLFTCGVELYSTAGVIKPVRLGTTLKLFYKCAMADVQRRFFGQLASLRKNGEVYWWGNYINICEMRPDLESKSIFEKFFSYLGRSNSVAAVRADKDTTLLLLPDCPLTFQLGLTKPHQYRIALHCIFLSKQSCTFKSPRYLFKQSDMLQGPGPQVAGSLHTPLHINISSNGPSSPSIFTPPPSTTPEQPWSTGSISTPPVFPPISSHSLLPVSPPPPPLVPSLLPPPPPPQSLAAPVQSPKSYPGSPSLLRPLGSRQRSLSGSQPSLGVEYVPSSPGSPSRPLLLSPTHPARRSSSPYRATSLPVSGERLGHGRSSSTEDPFLEGDGSAHTMFHRPRALSSPDNLHSMDASRWGRSSNLHMAYDEGFQLGGPPGMLNTEKLRKSFASQLTMQRSMEYLQLRQARDRTAAECEQDATITSTCVEDMSDSVGRPRTPQSVPPRSPVAAIPVMVPRPLSRQRSCSHSPSMESPGWLVDAAAGGGGSLADGEPVPKRCRLASVEGLGPPLGEMEPGKTSSIRKDRASMRDFLDSTINRDEAHLLKSEAKVHQVAVMPISQRPDSSTDTSRPAAVGMPLLPKEGIDTANEMKNFLNASLSQQPKPVPKPVAKQLVKPKTEVTAAKQLVKPKTEVPAAKQMTKKRWKKHKSRPLDSKKFKHSSNEAPVEHLHLPSENNEESRIPSSGCGPNEKKEIYEHLFNCDVREPVVVLEQLDVKEYMKRCKSSLPSNQVDMVSEKNSLKPSSASSEAESDEKSDNLHTCGVKRKLFVDAHSDSHTSCQDALDHSSAVNCTFNNELNLNNCSEVGGRIPESKFSHGYESIPSTPSLPVIKLKRSKGEKWQRVKSHHWQGNDTGYNSGELNASCSSPCKMCDTMQLEERPHLSEKSCHRSMSELTELAVMHTTLCVPQIEVKSMGEKEDPCNSAEMSHGKVLSHRSSSGQTSSLTTVDLDGSYPLHKTLHTESIQDIVHGKETGKALGKEAMKQKSFHGKKFHSKLRKSTAQETLSSRSSDKKAHKSGRREVSSGSSVKVHKTSKHDKSLSDHKILSKSSEILDNLTDSLHSTMDPQVKSPPLDGNTNLSSKQLLQETTGSANSTRVDHKCPELSLKDLSNEEIAHVGKSLGAAEAINSPVDQKMEGTEVSDSPKKKRPKGKDSDKLSGSETVKRDKHKKENLKDRKEEERPTAAVMCLGEHGLKTKRKHQKSAEPQRDGKDRSQRDGKDKSQRIGKERSQRDGKERSQRVGKEDKSQRVGKEDKSQRDGKERSQRVGKEDKDQIVGKDKDQRVGKEDKSQRDGKDRDQRIGKEDKSQRDGKEDKDQIVGKDKDQRIGKEDKSQRDGKECKNQRDGKNKDQRIGKEDKGQRDGKEDKDQIVGKDKDQRIGKEDKNQRDGKDRSQRVGKEDKSQRIGKEDKDQIVGKDKDQIVGKDKDQKVGKEDMGQRDGKEVDKDQIMGKDKDQRMRTEDKNQRDGKEDEDQRMGKEDKSQRVGMEDKRVGKEDKGQRDGKEYKDQIVGKDEDQRMGKEDKSQRDGKEDMDQIVGKDKDQRMGKEDKSQRDGKEDKSQIVGKDKDQRDGKEGKKQRDGKEDKSQRVGKEDKSQRGGQKKSQRDGKEYKSQRVEKEDGSQRVEKEYKSQKVGKDKGQRDGKEDKSQRVGKEYKSQKVGKEDMGQIVGKDKSQRIGKEDKSQKVGKEDKSQRIGNEDKSQRDGKNRSQKMGKEDKSQKVGKEDKSQRDGKEDKDQIVGKDKSQRVGKEDMGQKLKSGIKKAKMEGQSRSQILAELATEDSKSSRKVDQVDVGITSIVSNHDHSDTAELTESSQDDGKDRLQHDEEMNGTTSQGDGLKESVEVECSISADAESDDFVRKKDKDVQEGAEVVPSLPEPLFPSHTGLFIQQSFERKVPATAASGAPGCDGIDNLFHSFSRRSVVDAPWQFTKLAASYNESYSQPNYPSQTVSSSFMRPDGLTLKSRMSLTPTPNATYKVMPNERPLLANDSKERTVSGNRPNPALPYLAPHPFPRGILPDPRTGVWSSCLPRPRLSVGAQAPGFHSAVRGETPMPPALQAMSSKPSPSPASSTAPAGPMRKQMKASLKLPEDSQRSGLPTAGKKSSVVSVDSAESQQGTVGAESAVSKQLSSSDACREVATVSTPLSKNSTREEDVAQVASMENGFTPDICERSAVNNLPASVGSVSGQSLEKVSSCHPEEPLSPASVPKGPPTSDIASVGVGTVGRKAAFDCEKVEMKNELSLLLKDDTTRCDDKDTPTHLKSPPRGPKEAACGFEMSELPKTPLGKIRSAAAVAENHQSSAALKLPASWPASLASSAVCAPQKSASLNNSDASAAEKKVSASLGERIASSSCHESRSSLNTTLPLTPGEVDDAGEESIRLGSTAAGYFELGNGMCFEDCKRVHKIDDRASPPFLNAESHKRIFIIKEKTSGTENALGNSLNPPEMSDISVDDISVSKALGDEEVDTVPTVGSPALRHRPFRFGIASEVLKAEEGGRELIRRMDQGRGLVEDRHKRQFHPYQRSSLRKSVATFNLLYTKRQLLSDLTTRTFRQKRTQGELVPARVDRDKGRFAWLKASKFCRSTVEEKEKVKNCCIDAVLDELHELEAEAAEDAGVLEKRMQMADMLDQIYEEHKEEDNSSGSVYCSPMDIDEEEEDASSLIEYACESDETVMKQETEGGDSRASSSQSWCEHPEVLLSECPRPSAILGPTTPPPPDERAPQEPTLSAGVPPSCPPLCLSSEMLSFLGSKPPPPPPPPPFPCPSSAPSDSLADGLVTESVSPASRFAGESQMDLKSPFAVEGNAVACEASLESGPGVSAVAQDSLQGTHAEPSSQEQTSGKSLTSQEPLSMDGVQSADLCVSEGPQSSASGAHLPGENLPAEDEEGLPMGGVFLSAYNQSLISKSSDLSPLIQLASSPLLKKSPDLGRSPCPSPLMQPPSPENLPPLGTYSASSSFNSSKSSAIESPRNLSVDGEAGWVETPEKTNRSKTKKLRYSWDSAKMYANKVVKPWAHTVYPITLDRRVRDYQPNPDLFGMDVVKMNGAGMKDPRLLPRSQRSSQKSRSDKLKLAALHKARSSSQRSRIEKLKSTRHVREKTAEISGLSSTSCPVSAVGDIPTDSAAPKTTVNHRAGAERRTSVGEATSKGEHVAFSCQQSLFQQDPRMGNPFYKHTLGLEGQQSEGRDEAGMTPEASSSEGEAAPPEAGRHHAQQRRQVARERLNGVLMSIMLGQNKRGPPRLGRPLVRQSVPETSKQEGFLCNVSSSALSETGSGAVVGEVQNSTAPPPHPATKRQRAEASAAVEIPPSGSAAGSMCLQATDQVPAPSIGRPGMGSESGRPADSRYQHRLAGYYGCGGELAARPGVSMVPQCGEAALEEYFTTPVGDDSRCRSEQRLSCPSESHTGRCSLLPSGRGLSRDGSGAKCAMKRSLGQLSSDRLQPSSVQPAHFGAALCTPYPPQLTKDGTLAAGTTAGCRSKKSSGTSNLFPTDRAESVRPAKSVNPQRSDFGRILELPAAQEVLKSLAVTSLASGKPPVAAASRSYRKDPRLAKQRSSAEETSTGHSRLVSRQRDSAPH